jgi:hypothetical protein
MLSWITEEETLDSADFYFLLSVVSKEEEK